MDLVTYVNPELSQHVDAIKSGFVDRDRHMAEVRAVRKGDFDKVAPGAFNEDWPRPIVANMINTIAQHAAAALSPLPTITCSSPSMTSDAARTRADRRTKIANGYYKASGVELQRQTSCDQFFTYGLMVASVEPDWDEQGPAVIYENPIGFYPVWDRRGRTVKVVREFTRRVVELAVEYPHLAPTLNKKIIGVNGRDVAATIRVVKYVDKDRIVMYAPDMGGLVFTDMANPLGRCPYVCTKKPNLDEEQQGTFDDLIWVQIARHFMQMLAVEAAAEAVEAPIVVPNDVVDVPVGANAIIRTATPGGVGRVRLDVPAQVWASIDHLKQEMQYGAIAPEALGGSIDASVVTGRGVQELMAGYSQQIAMCQGTIARHDEQVLALCFEMDEKFWPEAVKSIRGRLSGAQYQITYTPSKDIAGDYTVDAIYGGVKGLDPNRGLVWLLQNLGGGIVSKDYVRRNADADINPSEEESKIQLEQMRDTLAQAMSAYGQSMPALVQQGQDPSEIVSRIVQVTRGLQKGQSFEDILEKVFPPPAPAPAPGAIPGAPGDPALAAAGGGAPGAGDMFAPVAGAPATAGPGGRPDLQTLFAGLSGAGNPNMSAGVSRMIPAA
ncbi:hypothetical protein [Cellulomonas sp. WB94]|uniref:hypothetical protein n=1 Tax=Cellulomonas sp. WB94 TaxID=2173174 RepID=UPI001304D21B|nr:hypothetical protein [Cellulomonas sp. WB94]